MEVMESFPTLRLTQGRKVDFIEWTMLLCMLYDKCYLYIVHTIYWQVLEIRPSIAWDKGKALEFILHALGKRFGMNIEWVNTEKSA